MVLRALILVSLVACSHRTVPAPAAPGSAGQVTLAVVTEQGVRGPPGLLERLVEHLKLRGYIVHVVEAHHLAGHQATVARLQALAGRSQPNSHHLLAELDAEQTGQLGGAFRWELKARLTVAPRGQRGEQERVDFHLPIFLERYTDGWDQALLRAAPELAHRAQTLLDRHREDGGPSAESDSTLEPQRRPIYLVLVDRFANGDSGNDGNADATDAVAYHGGDLQGLTQRLDWIQELGMGQVWITPVARSRKMPFEGHGAFHGYWVEDLREWDTRFGNDRVAEALRHGLDQRGLRLILDLVVNHVDYDAPLVTQFPHWFHQHGEVVDFRDPTQRVTGRVHGLPDLAQDEPEVFAYLSAAARTWHQRLRPDGYRIDAVQHVAADFTSRYGALLRELAEPAPVVLGEVFEGNAWALAQAVKAHGLEQAFDFPLYYAMKEVFCEGANPGRAAAIFAVDGLYPAARNLVTFLDNHDLPRILSVCAGDSRAVERALVFLFAVRGIPSITYGTEVGLAGSEEPANRGDMRFVDHPLRETIARLSKLREARSALHSGQTRILALGEDHLALLRHRGSDGVLLLLNHGSEAATVSLPKGLESGRTLTGQAASSDGALSIGPQRIALVEVGGAYLQNLGAARARVVVELKDLPDAEDEFRVVGLGSALGHWQPKAGLPAKGGRAVLDLPADSVAEFKLVRMKKGRVVEWEPRTNRYLHVRGGMGPVELQWGK